MVVIRQELYHGNKNIASRSIKDLMRQNDSFLFLIQQKERF
jgi:hypothetical protein